MNVFDQADTRLFKALFNLTANGNCVLARWVSRSGDGHVYLALGLILWAFEPDHGALFLSTSLLAYGLELPIYVALKKSFKRQRPCDFSYHFRSHIVPSDKFSLPSGHTAAAFLMASLLSHFYPSVSVWVYVWASLIGLSRILLGVHYPSDILAGAVLGLSISFLSLAMLG